MKAVKRLEIVIAARQMTQVCRLLEQHGVSGYTLIREVAGKGERGMQFAGIAAEQHGDAVLGGHEGDLQVGNAGPGLFAGGPRLLDFAGPRQARLVAPFGDLHRLVLARQMVAGDRDAALVGAQLHVVPGELGDQGDAGVVDAGCAGGEVGVGCLDAAPGAPEQIDLPGSVEANVIERARGLGRDGLGIPGSTPTGGGGHRGIQAGHRRLAARARLLQARLGEFRIEVSRQRLLDQAVESRVTELGPPPGESRVLPGSRLRTRWRSRPRGRQTRIGRLVVRADHGQGACPEQHGGGEGEDSRWHMRIELVGPIRQVGP